MSFHNILFPEFLTKFLIVIPAFSTSSVICSSNREIRSLNHEYIKNKYIFENCFLSDADFQVFSNFFKARRGARFSFKIKDPLDFSIEKHTIAQGDGSLKDFQIQKFYEDLVNPYIRKISQIKKDSLKIYLNNKQNDDWQIDNNSGVIKFNNPPTQDAVISCDCEFYHIVRFSNDSFEYTRKSNGAIEILNTSLIEVIE